MFRAILTAILVVTAAGSARADGMHFARAAPSPMPAQCAVLSWHDGLETLAIRTEISADAGPGAWVVPTPSVPEIFEVEPGVVESARAAFAPRIAEPRTDLLFIAAFLGVAVVLGHIAGAARGPIVTRVVLLLLAFAAWAVVLLGGLTMGHPRGIAPAAGASPGSGVTLHDLRTVGAHEVAVISSQDPQALARWLRGFGLAVPAAAESPIAAYCREGWSFVAARLDDTEAGLQAPQPVGMRFRTPAPVYPMRLTAIGNSAQALDLELLLYGPGVAAVPGMAVESAGPVEPVDEAGSFRGPRAPGETIRAGHEGVRALIAGAPWATLLRGTFTPSAMAADLAPTFRPPVPIRRAAMSRGGLLLGYLTAGCFGFAAVGVLQLPIARRPWTRPRAGLTGLVVLAVALAGGLWANRGLHSTVVVREDGSGEMFRTGERMVSAWMQVWIAKPAPASVQQARGMFETAWAEESPGRKAPGFGRGPGQYMIREVRVADLPALEFSWVNWFGQREVLDALPLAAPQAPAN